ncbi:DnaJ domain-containing protein [Exiguobacterium sp. s37]|uniref:J domain-containing protein n=1 Tax=Exiguobacterium sp. s37 TaxID=2751275 RepID=UPI001BE66293|nr:DnaJ domain-containing protein [Exiguobacterium sp. s37]
MFTLIVLGVMFWAGISFIENMREEEKNDSSNHKHLEDPIEEMDLRRQAFKTDEGLLYSGDAIFFSSMTNNRVYAWYEVGQFNLSHQNDLILFTLARHFVNGSPRLYIEKMNINSRVFKFPIGKFSDYFLTLEKERKMRRVGENISLNAMNVVAEVMAFNKFSREVISFKRLKATTLEQQTHYLKDYDSYLDSARNRIFDLVQDTFQDENSYSEDSGSKFNQREESFTIYLKVLEFESVHNVTFEQVRKQYKKLARRYHPDSETGDEYRFKLIREAYEFLESNYPK